MKKNKKAWTLVEIMLVAGIIALLSAIALPNLLRNRLQANEAAAQVALQTIALAESSYRDFNPQYETLANLGAASPSYIDSVLASGVKQGYTFVTTDLTATTFHCSAVPQTQNATGVRSFCITEDNMLRVKPTGGTILSRVACRALSPAQ